MLGSDGADYQNKSVSVETVNPERIVFDHVSGPRFQVVATFAEQAGKTKLTFRMRFASAAECDKVKAFAVEANEQNFDRLGFREYGYPSDFYLLAGTMETLGALALLIPQTAVYGAAVLSMVMIGATGTLLLHSQFLLAAFPFFILILLAIVGYARRRQPMLP